MSDTYWFPEDKAWMKARKEQWRTIKFNLDLISRHGGPMKRRHHKYHKELFFYGTIDEAGVWSDEDRSLYPNGVPFHEISGLTAFWSMLPVFRIWYHPRPDLMNIDRLHEEYGTTGYMEGARDRYFQEFLCVGGIGSCYPPEYGMMGGREERVVRFLCPRLDYRDVFIDERYPDHPMLPCFTPFYTYVNCMGGTKRELTYDVTFYPYSPGQYLWDHLDYALTHYREDILNEVGKQGLQDILVVMAEILGFEERTDPSRNRPSTIDMVQRLIVRYERKDFSDPVLNLWDEAKKDIGALREHGRKLKFFGMEENELDNFFGADGGYPIEKQREWRARWKQV